MDMAEPIEGLLCIDKPPGPTSHDIINVLRRLSGIRRIGHAGTLDPLASGLLLVCLGRATRLLEYLVGQPKTYLATIKLGQETSTYDAEGELVAERPVDVTAEQLSVALKSFRGPISQLAPIYSAVKVGGQPLYRRARRGENVERPKRKVTVHELDLLGRQGPCLELRVHCSSGTYIRSLAHDLGQSLGCGAYLADLRRMSVGSFAVEDAIPLARVEAGEWRSYLRPSDSAVGHLRRLELSTEEALALYHGKTVPNRSGQSTESPARAYDDTSRFVGVVVADESLWRAKKIFYQPG
jgi:tRNA pseudouridine55 synthase